MNELEKARAIIDECDELMARAFEIRFHAVQSVSEYKVQNGLPVFDAAREEAVIKKGLAKIGDENLKPYYERFLKSLMELSKEYQEELKK